MTHHISLWLVDRQGERVSARESLRHACNGWLIRQDIALARETAETGSDEECERLLAELEDNVNNAYGMWRAHQ